LIPTVATNRKSSNKNCFYNENKSLEDEVSQSAETSCISNIPQRTSLSWYRGHFVASQRMWENCSRGIISTTTKLQQLQLLEHQDVGGRGFITWYCPPVT